MANLLEKKEGLPVSKLDTRLRMYSNGNFMVNSIRSEFSGSVAVRESVKLKPEVCKNQAYKPKMLTTVEGAYKKGDIDKEKKPDDILTNVFIEFTAVGASKANSGVDYNIISQKGNLAIAEVPLTQVKELAGKNDVLSVESSQSLTHPRPMITQSSAAAPATTRLSKSITEANNGGANVLIGIIDVGGFDFAHPDFLDPNDPHKTRFVRIWDQDGTARPSPDGFGFGAEFKKEHLDAALANAASVKVPPQYIEKQSQMHEGSHGTHVASIAAGNLGICPKADIAGVLIALKEDEDHDRRKSFFDSSRIALSVDYLLQLAGELGKSAVSINISLGTNGHSHDGSAAVNRWLDAQLARPGACVSVAAGNAGQEAPLDEHDMGYIMGRIHTSGKIESTGLTKDIEWVVVGNGLADISENELEIWYSPQDRFSISIKPPGMDWIGPVHPGEFIENQQLVDGSFFSIYNELFHPSNGSNYISIYLSPNLNELNVVGIAAGTWKIRLFGDEIRDGNYHGWIERDDPRPLGRSGNKELWNFPSFFTTNSNVDNSSVNTLACGLNIISVGNYDTVSELINKSSSQGPTRDNRFKPEVAAPGTDIIAAKGFSSNDDLWIGMTGTSMASPYVCGVAALMLGIEPSLSAPQIAGIMMRTSSPVTGSTYAWRGDAGFGIIAPNECLKETRTIFRRRDITTKKLKG